MPATARAIIVASSSHHATDVWDAGLVIRRLGTNAIARTTTTSVSAGTNSVIRNRISNAVATSASGRCHELAAESAAVDAVAKRRPLDLQQLRRLGLVSAARLERPADQIRLHLADPIVE